VYDQHATQIIQLTCINQLSG